MNNNNYYGPSQLGYGNNQNNVPFKPNSNNNNINSQWGYNNHQQVNMVGGNQGFNQAQYQSNLNNQYPSLVNNQYQPLNNQYESGKFGSTQLNQANQSQNSTNLFGQLLSGGGLNKLNNTNNNNNNTSNQNLQAGLNIWADVIKNLDWDSLLKNKNFTKKQSDTSWINYQQKSWLQQKPSDHIQRQADRKFSFPNPFIKYKIIPGVDQKMALDVTAKDDLQQGLVKGSLIIWDYHGGPNQQFYIHRCKHHESNLDKQQFILINASNGFVVSALNLNPTQLKNDPKMQNSLFVYPKIDQNPSQRWRLKSVNKNNQIFTIESVKTNKVLDCAQGKSKNGTKVIQWSVNNGKNQYWRIIPA